MTPAPSPARISCTAIERLECRIAPAALAGGKLTYTDVDGDLVTITFSKKTGLDVGDFVFDTAFAATGPQKLLGIELADDAALAGANVTMKITKAASGDGRADVGRIAAPGVNLGAVKIVGDLRQIIVGDAQPKTLAIKSLSVLSFGRQGEALATPAGATLPAELDSTINGVFGKIAIAEDFVHASLRALAFGTAKSGSLTIGGQLLGGDANGEGVISLPAVASVKVGGIIGGNVPNPDDPSVFLAHGGVLEMASVGSLTVTGDVEGGNFFRSGSIRIFGAAAKVAIGGQLLGGRGSESGYFSAGGAVGSLTVGGIVGGNLAGPGDFVAGGTSGAVDLLSSVGTLTIRDGIIGGSISSSGSVFVAADVKRVSLSGNLAGGAGNGSGSLRVEGKITTLKVVGSILGGTGDESGLIDVLEIGSATVVGDLVGSDTTPATPPSVFGLTGGIEAFRIGTLKITGSILGGDGREEAGGVKTNEIKYFTLTGSVEGGALEESGSLDLRRVTGAIVIQGGLTGGAGEESGSLSFENSKSLRIGGLLQGGAGVLGGSVLAEGIVGAVTLGGIAASTGVLSGSLINQFGTIKSVLVKGDVIGLATNPAHIAATGGLDGLTISSVAVNGKVEHARITAGFFGDIFSFADASIGKVTIGGDFIASVIAAGVDPQDDFFADGDDALIVGSEDPSIIARIGSVLIRGAVTGTGSPADDSFGIVAEEIGKVTIGKTVAALTTGARNDTTGVLLGSAMDVRAQEIA